MVVFHLTVLKLIHCVSLKSISEYSVCRTHNPAVLGLSPAFYGFEKGKNTSWSSDLLHISKML